MDTASLDVSVVVLSLGRWLHQLEHLAADQDFDGWRHEEESGSLLHLLRGARVKAEDLRFLDEPERSQRLAMLWRALPLARLDQLVGNGEPDEDRAA